jgi:hypothetical protein
MQVQITRLIGHSNFASVHNPAHVQLSKAAKTILSLGQGFVPSQPRSSCTSALHIHASVKDFSWRIYWNWLYRLRGDRRCPPFFVRKIAAVQHWTPTYPSSRVRVGIQLLKRYLLAKWAYAFRGYFDQKKSLPRAAIMAISALRCNPHIIIRPADKNMGLCVVKRDWYIQKCLEHLLSSRDFIEIPSIAMPMAIEYTKTRLDFLLSSLRTLYKKRSWLLPKNDFNLTLSIFRIPTVDQNAFRHFTV